jgi:hypothetical protein
MAAFTHLNPDRIALRTERMAFSMPGARSAIAETRYHRVRFLQATSEPAQEIDMRVGRALHVEALSAVIGCFAASWMKSQTF